MAELEPYSRPADSSGTDDSDVKQIVLENKTRIGRMISRLSEHIESQKNVNLMLYKVIEGFQKDMASVKMPKKTVSGEGSDLKSRRMMQRIESFENRLKNDEMHDDDLAKNINKLRSAITDALEFKTTVLEKDIHRVSADMVPIKGRLSTYEKELHKLMNSEKLDVTELAKRFDLLSKDVSALASGLEGSRSESSKMIGSVREKVSSIRENLDKHQVEIAAKLDTKMNDNLKTVRKQLGYVQKSIPHMKSSISLHNRKLSSLESKELADIGKVTGRMDEMQKILQSLSNELDKDERYTRTRMKSLRERISLSKSDVEKKMRENVSSIISQINAVSTRIPE
ncbi:MAG: hypothetical protein U9O53_04490, partial [archaeon]|nr:hypothetical protein [archaeon]